MISVYCGGAITWASNRQKCVSLSTTEAEYVAACEAAKEAVWLKRLFEDISPLKSVPTLIVDSTSAMKLSKNPEFHKKSKHIDVRYHYLRDQVVNDRLCMTHVCSEQQVADICTKPIPRVQFCYLRSLIGMY